MYPTTFVTLYNIGWAPFPVKFPLHSSMAQKQTAPTVAALNRKWRHCNHMLLFTSLPKNHNVSTLERGTRSSSTPSRSRTTWRRCGGASTTPGSSMRRSRKVQNYLKSYLKPDKLWHIQDMCANWSVALGERHFLLVFCSVSPKETAKAVVI